MSNRKISFNNIQIAQGYARILRHPLEISVDFSLPNRVVLSKSWQQSEMYIKKFCELIPSGVLIHLTEVIDDKSTTIQNS